MQLIAYASCWLPCSSKGRSLFLHSNAVLHGVSSASFALRACSRSESSLGFDQFPPLLASWMHTERRICSTRRTSFDRDWNCRLGLNGQPLACTKLLSGVIDKLQLHTSIPVWSIGYGLPIDRALESLASSGAHEFLSSCAVEFCTGKIRPG